MIEPIILHYVAAAIAIGLGSIGGGIGHGIAGFAALDAMQRQPAANNPIFRAMFIALALIESGIIIAFIIALLLCFSSGDISLGAALTEIGISLLIGVAATVVSIASSFTATAAVHAISRHPMFAQKIHTMMLLTQSIIEAPIIFAFIVCLLMRSAMTATMTIAQGWQLFAGGLATMLGCIGPSIGLGFFTYAACTAIGYNTKAYNKIFPFSLLAEAIIETPMIFSLVMSFLIIYHPSDPHSVSSAYIYLASAFSIGISAIGSAAGIGFAAAKSVRALGVNPDVTYNILFKNTLLIATFIESSVIYGLVISLLLLFRVM